MFQSTPKPEIGILHSPVASGVEGRWSSWHVLHKKAAQALLHVSWLHTILEGMYANSFSVLAHFLK
jgi:hypothetical protein